MFTQEDDIMMNKYRYYDDDVIIIHDWESVTELMNEDALRDTFDDMTWTEGDIQEMLQVYALYHAARTGQHWSVVYIAK